MVERMDRRLHLLSPGDSLGVIHAAPLARTSSGRDFTAKSQQNLCLLPLADEVRNDILKHGSEASALERPTVGGLPSFVSGCDGVDPPAGDVLTPLCEFPVGARRADLWCVTRPGIGAPRLDNLEHTLPVEKSGEPRSIYCVHIGMIANPDYCELAARRLAQQSIFSLGGEL